MRLQQSIKLKLQQLKSWVMAEEEPQPDAFWRSLLYFNWYRLVVVLIVTLLLWQIPFQRGGAPLIGSLDHYFYAAALYLVFAAITFYTIASRKPRFNLQLSWQVTADILFVTLLMAYSNEGRNGFGLLLIPYLAGASLISRGRMSMFHAALAAIAVLAHPLIDYVQNNTGPANLGQTALLATGYFATAVLAHKLSEQARRNERLAFQRGEDVAQLAQLNQLIIQAMPNGVMLIDGAGQIRQLNRTAEVMLGIKAQAQSLAHEFPALYYALDNWHLSQNFSSEPLRAPQTRTLITPRFADLGLPQQGVVVFLEDAEQQQTQAQQLKLAALGRLTANIAHEIRNPLSAIRHSSDLLQEDIDNPIAKRMLQIIQDNTVRINKIIQDVLELNHRDRVQLSCFNLGQFMDDFAAELYVAEQIDAKLAPLIMSKEAKESRICFDRTHLQQVLWNLCRNGLRFCSRRYQSLQMKVTLDEVHACIDIQDDGQGIPPELRSQIFEPFFTTDSQGNGLGLYIAKEICEANQAQLEYLDCPQGALFRIRIKKESYYGTTEPTL